METGQTIELEIIDVGLGGVGVGRHEGLVVFVPFVDVGETVSVELEKVQKRFASGRLVKVLKPSAHRQPAPCKYYGRCGGCEYQHIDYAQEQALKQKQLHDTYQRLGGLKEPPLLDFEAAPQEYGYRNKITLHGPGKPGFMNVDGDTVVPIESCMLAREPVNALIERIPAVPERGDYACRASAGGQQWCSVDGDRRAVLDERVAGKLFRYGAESFFQVNVPVFAKIVAHLDAILGEKPCVNLIDAYCGVGVFSVLLANRAGTCHGIEVDRQATHAAAANAAEANAANCEFYAGRLERVLPGVLEDLPSEGLCVLLDPPRSGCPKPVLDVLRQKRPERVLYVSCNPATQARDIKNLTAAGYGVKSLKGFDMFPRTGHVEVVAELQISTGMAGKKADKA